MGLIAARWELGKSLALIAMISVAVLGSWIVYFAGWVYESDDLGDQSDAAYPVMLLAGGILTFAGLAAGTAFVHLLCRRRSVGFPSSISSQFVEPARDEIHAPAGWYPDPAAPQTQLRFWQGDSWSSRTRPLNGFWQR